MSPRKKPPPRSLLDALLFAPDRESIPGARPVVSRGIAETPEYLRELDALGPERIELSRRGVPHGGLARLDLRSYGLPEHEPLGDTPSLRKRWHEARPLVLPGIASEYVSALGDELGRASEGFKKLGDPGALADFVRSAELPEGVEITQRRPALDDPDRDIEKLTIHWDGGWAKEIRDLWIKSGFLSTHDDDASMRVRLSFGHEGGDDSSEDEFRHQLVAELSDALFPEGRALTQNGGLLGAIEAACGEEIYLTQTIAYWNAPEGGASFHHDAFKESGHGAQRGVCYLQLSGATAWLALSITDLAARTREFIDALKKGDKRWLRDQIFGGEREFERALSRVQDRSALMRELALPGCGELGALVNRGPEFTAFLADAGHAVVLDEGDAILLPNHGLGRTTMHSVFCASEHPTYALSMAIRATHPQPRPPVNHQPETDKRHTDDQPDMKEIRKRRRESPRRRERRER